MLVVHRRHTEACPHKEKGRIWRKCSCPLWIDWRVHGKRIQKPLSTRDWGVAQIQAREIEVQGLTAAITPTTVEMACEKFLMDAVARRLKEESLRKYRQLFKGLRAYAEEKGIPLLNNLGPRELLEFRAGWPNEARSAKKKLELLKAFFRHCLLAQMVTSDPSAGIKPPKVVEEQVIPFTDEQEKAILAACDARLKALVLLMRYSGLRITDACTLSRDRVRDGVLTLRTEKGGTTVRVPLHPEAVAALAALPMRGPYYFWTGTSKRRTVANFWQQQLLEMFRRAGVVGHSHQFRHRFAVKLLERGASLEDVSILLGHRDIKITQRTYSAWVPARRDRLERIVRDAW
jgi:integrase/recombinase XerD